MVPGQMTSVPLVGFDIEHVCLPPPPGGSPSTPDTFNEDRDTTHSSVPTSNYACRLCHLQFTTITEMQRHFKSEAHINSIHATRVTNYVGELESRRLNSPKLFFSFNNALYSVYKVCFSSLPCSLAELQFELSQLKDAIWVIILIRSGYFSLGIYELVTSKCIASKQLKRYYRFLFSDTRLVEAKAAPSHQMIQNVATERFPQEPLFAGIMSLN